MSDQAATKICTHPTLYACDMFNQPQPWDDCLLCERDELQRRLDRYSTVPANGMMILWPPGSHGPSEWSISIHNQQAIGITFGGLCIVKTAQEWHRIANVAGQAQQALDCLGADPRHTGGTPAPLKHQRRVVGHVSGWQEQMETCVCGAKWPCPAVETTTRERETKSWVTT